jgi:hypothetical protein
LYFTVQFVPRAEGVREYDDEVMFGPKRDEVTGEWRGLHNEELYDLYYSLNIIQVIKSTRM